MQIVMMPLRRPVNPWGTPRYEDLSPTTLASGPTRDAYLAGRNAFLEGLAISQIPDFVLGSDRWAWIAGWQGALNARLRPDPSRRGD
jgi:hypothetical protein